jgi:DNA-binding CsgD family transcriptional regulator
VGATREQAFTETEIQALRRLTKPLENRLRLERQLLRPDILTQALDAALEALQTPAFVVGPSGAVEFANQAGLELWKRNRSSLFASIKQSEASDSGTEEFSVSRLGGAGQGYRLAVRREPCHLASRLPIAVRAWGLTTRQARVLECVASGASNKEIALALTCSEVTVENHITELFRRSNTRSRASLVSKLLR